jgi:hypothetical protein
MIGKKINQLATELAPESTDLTIIGDPTTGVSKKITIAQLGAIFSGAVSFYTNLAAFPVTGDINVIYCAKDTQKLYLWSGSAYVEVFPSQALLDTYQLRSEKGNANGYASLDSLGKVPISQLPSSIMEYKGTWNAATNTPTLANGTGDTGDVYICNVAGTVNFGAGPITFAVGDYVIYSGTIWQRSSGAVGTVTSVAASITGNSVSISGSPIVTSGTLAFSFAGNATQYVRGDGQLSTLPTNGGGGGASVSYYLNGSINQGTIGGVTYYEMNKTPIIGAGTDFTRNSNGYIASFLTDANDPALLNIPAGNFNFETYFEASSGGGSPTFYIELYKYDGTTFTLIASNSGSPKLINDGTNIEAYFSALAVPQTTLTLTDRLAIRIYVTTAGRTITLHTENGHLCQVITTFTTGLTALNGLTAQVQYLATGTSGTDFNIASSTATHTFNIPTASATNRGALSSADWTTFNNKQNALTLTTTGSSGDATLVGATLNIPNYGSALTGYVPYTGATGNVNLGTNDFLTRSVFIEGATNYQAGLLMKQYSVYNFVTGAYTQIAPSTATELNIVHNQANTTRRRYALSVAALQDGDTFQYLVPRASGTLALTSDLGAYLPLAGGTMTGAIIGTTSTFTNAGSGIGVEITNSSTGDGLKINHSSGRALNIASSGSGFGIIINNTTASTSAPFTIQKQGSSVITLSDNGAANFAGQLTLGSTITNGTNTFTLPGASGTLALTSAIPANPVGGTGTTNYLPKFTGTSTIGDSVIQEASSNIGIGGSPSTKLHSFGTIRSSNAGNTINTELQSDGVYSTATDLYLLAPSTKSIIFYTNNVPAMLLNASGNLSIGNTNDTFKLDVTGTGRFTSSLTTTQLISLSASGSAALFLKDGSANNKWEIGHITNSLYFYNYTRGGNDLILNGSTGAATFSSSVTASGSIYSTVTSGNSFVLNSTGTNYGFIQNDAADKWSLGTGTTISSLGTPVLTWTKGGNVGIGTTNPTEKLQVSGQIRAENFGIFRASSFRGGLYTYDAVSGTGTDYGVTIFAEGGTGNGNIYFCPGGSVTRQMTITTSGNVCIGTATTTGLLTLGKAGGGQYIGALNTTNGYEIGYLQFNTDNITINPQGGASGNDSYIRMLTAGTERMLIKSSGIINLSNVPSSSAGLSSGDIYKTVAGVLMIV